MGLFFSFSLNAQNYIPDPSFGEAGAVVTNYNMYFDNDQAPRNVVYENERYIFTQKTQLSCFNYDGTVDFTFGTSGYSRIIIPNCTPNTITITSSKVLNNSLFIFGKAYDPNTSSFYGFIGKMGMDGVFDTTFGSNGIVTVTIGTTANDPYSDGITDMVLKNGNYFCVGTSIYTDSNGIFRKNVFVAKFNGSGTMDVSLDPSGLKKITSIDGYAAKNIFDHQGDLLIIGHITNNNTGNENSLTMIKIDENGNLLSTFGDNGVKKIPLSPIGWQTGESFNNCNLTGDDLYVLRTYFMSTNVWQKIQKIDVTSLAITEISETNNGSAVRYMLDTDKIYILGCLNTCANDFNIVRRTIDGTLDTTFNQTGTFTYSFPAPNSFTTTYDTASVLVKDTYNRILIGGYTVATSYNAAPYRGFAMLRINDENLSLDEVGANHFAISPNPVRSDLYITHPKGDTIDAITLFDVLGKRVYYAEHPVSPITLEALREGLYFVKIQSGSTTDSHTIIKRN